MLMDLLLSWVTTVIQRHPVILLTHSLKVRSVRYWWPSFIHLFLFPLGLPLLYLLYKLTRIVLLCWNFLSFSNFGVLWRLQRILILLVSRNHCIFATFFILNLLVYIFFTWHRPTLNFWIRLFILLVHLLFFRQNRKWLNFYVIFLTLICRILCAFW